MLNERTNVNDAVGGCTVSTAYFKEILQHFAG
jgi:hypothetical protein